MFRDLTDACSYLDLLKFKNLELDSNALTMISQKEKNTCSFYK